MGELQASQQRELRSPFLTAMQIESITGDNPIAIGRRLKKGKRILPRIDMIPAQSPTVRIYDPTLAPKFPLYARLRFI